MEVEEDGRSQGEEGKKGREGEEDGERGSKGIIQSPVNCNACDSRHNMHSPPIVLS